MDCPPSGIGQLPQAGGQAIGNLVDLGFTDDQRRRQRDDVAGDADQEAGVEKALLTHERTCGHEAEIHRLDRGGGVQRREVRVQRAKKNCRVGGGLGQPEAARVACVVLEAEREFDPGGDVLRRDQFE